MTADDDWQQCPDPDTLKQMAHHRTGLGDFGEPARDLPLAAYVSSLRQESWPHMSIAARRQAIDFIVHHLGTRAKLIADRKRHPEIAQQQIRRPMILVGPPRSGSTLLHTLLSLDPQHMAPEHWMCLEPSPPPALGPAPQERIERATQRMMSLFELIPDIFVTHPYMIEEGSGALAECGADILVMCCTSQQLWCCYRGESYRRHLLEADHRAAMRFHHEFLQHLQWGTPGKRWVLKSADHLLWLGELAAQYPDAMLVWTHRDLAQQLGSLASTQAILCGMRGTPVSGAARREVGRLANEHQLASFRKGMRAREAIGEERFFDVSYHDVMADPVGTVERLYSHFGLEPSAMHVARIHDWLARNPQTKHGTHRYSPEEFAMDGAAINRQFDDYIQRFGFGFGIRPPLHGQR